MHYKVLIFGLAAFGLMATGESAQAKKKPWDAERYAQCLQATGTDELAPDLMISSQRCRTGRDPVEKSEGLPIGAKVRAWVAGARNKDDPKKAFVSVALGVKFERTSTYFGGATVTSDKGGSLGIGSVFAMVGGQRQELKITAREGGQPDCNFMSNGAMGVQTCTFTEAVVVLLPVDLLNELALTYQSDVESTFRFRVETSNGSITVLVPIAEIEAVRRGIFPVTQGG